MVLQDVFLFSGSVGNNIRLGEAAIDDERVRWAAREVHADSFIEQLPGGFAAPVRERGRVSRGAEAAHRLRPRARLRSPHPDPRRGRSSIRHARRC